MVDKEASVTWVGIGVVHPRPRTHGVPTAKVALLRLCDQAAPNGTFQRYANCVVLAFMESCEAGAPNTAHSNTTDVLVGLLCHVLQKGKSAADRNKELNMERERRNERLQNKKGNRRASVGKSVSKVDEDDGPKIRVCVRKRPLSRREKNRKEVDVLKPVSRQTMLVYEPK